MEFFCKKMQTNGSSAGTAHQVHRTVRAALTEAKRRRHLTEHPANIAKALRLVEEEAVSYTVIGWELRQSARMRSRYPTASIRTQPPRLAACCSLPTLKSSAFRARLAAAVGFSSVAVSQWRTPVTDLPSDVSSRAAGTGGTCGRSD